VWHARFVDWTLIIYVIFKYGIAGCYSTLRTLSFVNSGEVASDEICFWWPLLLMTFLLMTCLQELFFRPVSSDAVLQTHSSRCSKLQIKFLCSWTCSIRIFMNSTLIMEPVHLNKLFSISNWWFLIPCYCQNLIGDLWNTLCSNKGNSLRTLNNKFLRSLCKIFLETLFLINFFSLFTIVYRRFSN